MATPRKHYFRVFDSLLRAPWPPDVKLTLVLLCAYLNGRWARDALGPQEACRATLSPGDLHQITGRAQLVHARGALRALGEHVSISIRERGKFTEIHWPKYSEFQGLGSESRPNPGRKMPSPRHASRDTRPAEEKSAPDGARPSPREASKEKTPDHFLRLWAEVRAVFAAYGKPLGERLAPARRSSMAARLRDHQDRPEVLVELIHGYVAFHGLVAQDGFDPRQHLTPETVYRCSHAPKYLEAHDEAIAKGRKPPFVSPESPSQEPDPRTIEVLERDREAREAVASEDQEERTRQVREALRPLRRKWAGGRANDVE